MQGRRRHAAARRGFSARTPALARRAVFWGMTPPTIPADAALLTAAAQQLERVTQGDLQTAWGLAPAPNVAEVAAQRQTLAQRLRVLATRLEVR